MKKVTLLFAVAAFAAFSFSSCKKCGTCTYSSVDTWDSVKGDWTYKTVTTEEYCDDTWDAAKATYPMMKDGKCTDK